MKSLVSTACSNMNDAHRKRVLKCQNRQNDLFFVKDDKIRRTQDFGAAKEELRLVQNLRIPSKNLKSLNNMRPTR